MTGPLCAGHEDPEMWFTEDPASQAAAVAVCQLCPVRAACAALGASEPFGVFGGLTAEERVGGWLLLDAPPGPTHPPSRGRYSSGCRCAGCEAANTAYIAAWRHCDRPAVTPARTVDPCEQLALDVMSA